MSPDRPAPPARLRIHGLTRSSRANGPGLRAVVWLQGCTLGCPGCFNPASHPAGPVPDPPGPDGRGEWPVDALAAEILARADRLEGVTVSGGEPLQQAAGLLALVDAIRSRSALSVLLFSGYTRAEIEELPLGPAILARVDVLIDGRYRAGERLAAGLRGSRNQEIHLLTERYSRAAVEAAPPGEISIAPDGQVTITGVDPPRIKL